MGGRGDGGRRGCCCKRSCLVWPWLFPRKVFVHVPLQPNCVSRPLGVFFLFLPPPLPSTPTPRHGNTSHRKRDGRTCHSLTRRVLYVIETCVSGVLTGYFMCIFAQPPTTLSFRRDKWLHETVRRKGGGGKGGRRGSWSVSSFLPTRIKEHVTEYTFPNELNMHDLMSSFLVLYVHGGEMAY